MSAAVPTASTSCCGRRGSRPFPRRRTTPSRADRVPSGAVLRDHEDVRPLVRLLAVFFALTWLVLPGFGLLDLSVTWDPDWPVVLEASWGVFMTVLVGGSLLAVAIRPQSAA